MRLNNKTFDILKWVARVVLPALITFYGVIGNTFAIPYTCEVLTILAGLDTFMATILGISTAEYNAMQPHYGESVPDKDEA